MTFSHLVGNAPVAAFLERMLETKRVPGTLLFLGKEGIGKGLFAKAFAQALLTGKKEASQGFFHPDLMVFKPEGKLALHSMASMRRLIEEVGLPPYQAPCRVIIIHDADRMLPYSSNALLKTLEEPTPYCHFILLAAQKQALLPTIVSRCQTLYFKDLANEEIADILEKNHKFSKEKSLFTARRAAGSLGKALRTQDGAQDKLEEVLWQILSQADSYITLTRRVATLHEWLETQRKQWEGQAREEIRAYFPEGLTKDVLEKEVEGAATLQLTAEFQEILEFTLNVYRDLHLLQCGGKEQYLHFGHAVPKLQACLQSGALPELEKVIVGVEKASLAQARSMPLSACLETLFVELLQV